LLKRGEAVNLERALRVGDRLGGHIVQGHVDTVGRVEELIPRGEHLGLRISFEKTLSVYAVEKGSIAVDGISLTINRCGEGWVQINVIPHTFENTNLKFRKRGDLVNLEFDVLGKYAVNYLRRIKRKEKIFEDFLNY
jgi:riboflavin synthase